MLESELLLRTTVNRMRHAEAYISIFEERGCGSKNIVACRIIIETLNLDFKYKRGPKDHTCVSNER